MEGYKDYRAEGPLPECRPFCGDGIIIQASEECDDNNTLTKDGCDQNCKK